MCGWENAPLWWELSDRIEPWTRKIVQKGLGVSRWLHLCHLTVIMEPKMGCELERFALLCYVGSTHPMDENRVLCFASMRKAFSTSSGILRATCPVDRCFPTVCLWYNKGREKCLRNADSETLSDGVPAYCTVTGDCLGRNKSHKVPGQESFGLLLDIRQRC